MKTKAQAGAANLVLVVTLPFVISMVSASIAGWLLLNRHNSLLHLCRVSLLEIESMRLQRLKQLKALNPQARRLRLARAEADRNLLLARTSLQPKAILAAEAAQKAVVMMQLSLATKQKVLLRTTELETVQRIGMFKKNLVSQSMASSEPRTIQVFRGPLSVVATPVTSLTPDYVETPQFEVDQLIRARWRFSAFDGFPSWLRYQLQRHFVSSNDISWTLGCSSKPKKQGVRNWQANLAPDR